MKNSIWVVEQMGWGVLNVYVLIKHFGLSFTWDGKLISLFTKLWLEIRFESILSQRKQQKAKTTFYR